MAIICSYRMRGTIFLSAFRITLYRQQEENNEKF